MPQGTFAEAIRAGGAGIGGFYTPVGAGTLLAEGKEERLIDGVPHVLEQPIRADVALVYAARGGRAREPLVPADGAELQPADGDGGTRHDRRGRRGRAGRRARARVGRDAAPLRRLSWWRRVSGDLKARIAERAARELRPGEVVNLGIGIPNLIPGFLGADSSVFLHTENGLLGVGPRPGRGRARSGPDRRREAADHRACRVRRTSTARRASR